MLIDSSGKGRWSDAALKAMAITIAVIVVLAVVHALLEMKIHPVVADSDTAVALIWIVNDVRSLFVQLVYVWAIIFVGAKFFETRTTFAVTFDRVDASKISVKGPDSDNIVWIGQRYGSAMEAQTVAATLENRLKENAV